MIADLRFALRQLRKAPAFALTAMLTLALGIGATTAIFTLVDDVMLRPLPFTHADRLVNVQEKVAEWSDVYPALPVSANHFTFWQQHSKSFAAIALMQEYPMPLGTSGHPREVNVLSATPEIFSLLDAQPLLGRAFTLEEAQPGHEHVAVLTHDLWRTEFGEDRSIVGRTVTLNGSTYTVIGVMPPSFHMPPLETLANALTRKADSLGILVPLAFSADRLAETMGDLNYFGLARLRPGVSLAAAIAELDAEQHAISASLPADEKATLSAVLTPWQDEMVGASGKSLMILLAAVAALLLVGCMNIANLLLARAVGQRQQMAVAAALGAGRREMLRMALRETAVLALAGCALGMFLAGAILTGMQRLLPSGLNFRGPLHLDWLGAGCALLLAGIATLLAGLTPAWLGSRIAPHEVLHSESRLASESRATRRMRRTLVGAEVAVSVMLVLLTGLVVVSLIKLMQVDRGFNAERTMTAWLELPSGSYRDKQSRFEFYRDVLAKLNALPGVEQAAVTNTLPLAGGGWGDAAQLPGDTRAWTQLPEEQFRWVSPRLFAALRLRLVAGRFFTDSEEGRNDAVITERTAKTLWHGRDPLGQQFRLAGRPEMTPFTVVGVVADARTQSLAEADPMILYVPYWYRCDGYAGLVVKTHQDPAAMAELIRKTVWSVDSGVPLPKMQTLGALVTDSVATRRFEMDLLLVFAVSALLLAGLGVYGVVTYSVVQRQREIGLRIALGAQRENIYRLVLRDGLVPVIAGAGVGVALALASARVAQSLLFEMSPYDPRMAAGAVCVLLVAGTAACWLPARRAARVEPMEALRNE